MEKTISAQGEQWQVSTVEGVFEADLDTLRQWIVEGCVLPTDKVCKGKLNWIDAGRAPMLRAAFNGEITTTSAAPPDTPPNLLAEPVSQIASAPAEAVLVDQVMDHAGPWSDLKEPVPQTYNVHAAADACHNHPDAQPKYVCRACASLFCQDCVKIVGTSGLAICPLCGELCRLFAVERNKAMRLDFQSSGFGFKDFARALRYPFQHKIALLCGALLYGFLLLAGIRGQVVAFVIMFGCIAHVISQVAWGRLEQSFLPDFSSFELWDDLIRPIGLGIGIAIVTWGPAAVVAVVLFTTVMSGPKVTAGLAPPVSQSSGMSPEELSTLTDPNADPKKLEEATAKLNQGNPAYQISKAAEESKKEQADPLADVRFLLGFLHLPILLVLLLLVTVAWAVFYGPMALAVAGYTQHFSSVVNPLVGLDTIKRMGGTYFKAFAMVLFIQIVGFVITAIVGIILAPFDIPFMGNLPAKFVDGSLTFYFNLVVACILGLSLYKCADRIGIGTD
jgi:hypothetical protein